MRFVGRGVAGSREEILARVEADPPELAWARQVHSARVLAAMPGECGEGDALFTRRSGLALSIVTADCVPVLLAGPEGIAAVHAGWRGIASGVIAAAVAALDAGGGEGAGAGVTAWIGPAIGLCCYEVGEEVAVEVARASAPEVVVPGPAGRPHLDLPGAAWRQLTAAGVGDVRCVVRCTRCDGERLASYRREGKGAGRNLAVIWRLPNS
ncbi:MAG TPA: laccase domain-containing protein [Thermoanaerobaculia bacterium]|nr:laccase domain-containing protein [Thermoanaerobaculia bacterium]